MTISKYKNIIVSNILLMLSASSIGQLSRALSIFITARLLGVEAFGQYSACFSLTKITSIIFTLGIDTWMLREGRSRKSTLGKLICSNMLIKSIMGIIWFISLWIISQFLDPKTFPPLLLCVCAITTWLEAAQETITYGFNIALLNQVTLILQIVSSVGLLIFTLGLTNIQHDSPIIFVLIRMVMALLATVGGLFGIQKVSPITADRSTVRFTLNSIFPYAISDAFVLIYTQADITIVAMLLGKQSAGYYSTASSIIRSLFIIPSAIYLVILPIMSKLIAEKNPSVTKTIRMLIISMAILGGILSLGTAILGPEVTKLLLGDNYYVSGQLLVVLSIILFFKSCSYALTSIVIATGKQNQRVVIQGIAAFLTILLDLIVIQKFNLIGAACVYVISETFLMASYFVIVYKQKDLLKSITNPNINIIRD